MKKLFTLIVVALYAPFVFAQAPQGFSYQAIARDNAGNPKANTRVGVKFSILSGSAQGATVYAETHQTQSNNFGLFTLTIGQGSAITGTFASIDWAGPKYLKVEIDGLLSNTTQLLSVPYALYAEKAKADIKAGAGIAVTGNEVSNTGDLSNTNEIQTLSLSGSTLNLSNGGGTVNLPSGGSSQWRDTTVDIKQIYHEPAVLVGMKGGFMAGAKFVVAQTDPNVSNNVIAIFNRNYDNVSTGLQLYGYPDHPSFNSYLRGYSMLYSPTINRGLQFTAATGDLRFTTGGFHDALYERMRITSNGNIGIGTTTPAAKLQISNGDVYIQNATNGVIMKSPDGSCWRMTVSNAGAPVFNKIACPN